MPSLTQPVEIWRDALFFKTTALLIGWGLFVGLLYLLAFRAPLSASIILGGTACGTGSLALLQFFARRRAALHLLLAALFAVVTGVGFLNGGPEGPTLGWYPTIAILALLLGGRRNGTPWALLSVFVAISFLISEQLGLNFAYELAPRLHPMNRSVVTIAALVTAVAAGIFYEIERCRFAQSLEEVNHQLRDSTAQLECLLESLPEGVLLVNAQGYIEFANVAAETMFGWNRHDFKGMKLREFLGNTPSRLSRLSAEILEPGDPSLQYEGPTQRRDGSLFPADLSVTALPGVRKFAVLVRDLTEQQAVQALLWESEERYRDLFENASDLIQSISPDGSIQFVNRAWCEALGYTLEEARGMTIERVIHPRHWRRCKRILERLSAGEEVGTVEAVFVAKDGREIPVEGRVNCRSQEGRACATRGIFRDVSERRRLDQMKQEFISTVSHELRSPLTSMEGALELLLRGAAGPLSPEVTELVQMASSGCERLIHLTNDILDVEKLNSHNLKLSLETCEMKTLAEQTVREMQGYAQKYDVSLTVEHDGDSFPVLGDPHRIIQIFANLLSNAAKFSPPQGTIRLRLSKTGDEVRVAVSDEGPGIPESFRPHIFQRFAQADASDHRRGEGTGLGLSISKALVEQMGGKIGFESSPGKGTTFFFTLPLLREKHQAA